MIERKICKISKIDFTKDKIYDFVEDDGGNLETINDLGQKITFFNVGIMFEDIEECFVNRHTNRLPDKKTKMRVVCGEDILLCEWNPFDKLQYTEKSMPSKGYLGTVRVIEGKYKDIGLHAWEQNNSEFVWYALEKKP